MDKETILGFIIIVCLIFWWQPILIGLAIIFGLLILLFVGQFIISCIDNIIHPMTPKEEEAERQRKQKLINDAKEIIRKKEESKRRSNYTAPKSINLRRINFDLSDTSAYNDKDDNYYREQYTKDIQEQEEYEREQYNRREQERREREQQEYEERINREQEERRRQQEIRERLDHCFAYKVRFGGKNGTPSRIVVKANSIGDARNKLEALGYYIVSSDTLRDNDYPTL